MQPEGLDFIPGCFGVGGKSSVVQNETCFVGRILKVKVEAVQVFGSGECLVIDGVGRKGCEERIPC